jgi:hypothetical protein
MAIPLNGSSFEVPAFEAPVRIPWSIPGYAFALSGAAATFRLAIPPVEIVLAPGNVEMIGASERVSGSESQGRSASLTPALKVKQFHFTSQSEAV